VIFVILGLILPLHAYHIWGSQKYIGNPWVRGTWQAPEAYNFSRDINIRALYYGYQLPPEWPIHVVIGVALMLAIYFARVLWPQFPLNVAGIALQGPMMGAGGWGWSPFAAFIVWIIKLAVIRVGGAELYRKTAPTAAGIVIGSALALVIEQTAIVLRYLSTLAF
jgi:hypothetical protein